MTWADRYRERQNAENLARQAEPVRNKADELLKELQDIQNTLYWALDPEERDPSYWTSSLIEHAHALVDLAHDYRAALKANPPSKIEDEDDDDDDFEAQKTVDNSPKQVEIPT